MRVIKWTSRDHYQAEGHPCLYAQHSEDNFIIWESTVSATLDPRSHTRPANSKHVSSSRWKGLDTVQAEAVV